MDPQKRSQAVMLTLVGLPVAAVTLANAFPPHQMRRNLYPDRAACEHDYSAAQCQSNSGSGTGSYAGGFHGPYYYGNRSAAAARSDPGPGRSGQVSRTEVSTRGGFGAFGRAMRAVG
jgi:hypothetical protein